MNSPKEEETQSLTDKEKAVDSLIFGGLFQAITTKKQDFNKKVILTINLLGASISIFTLIVWVVSNS